jgi:hypothetical protein
MSPKIINIIVISILVVLCLAILANSMTKTVGRDEQMYCTGGVLLAQGKTIYGDFSYVAQMPYHPLFCAALYKILNTNHYLLVGRLLSTVCDILVMVCIVGVYRRIFKPFEISGMLFGLAGAILYVFNPSVDYANGFAWNNDVVILCVVLAFWLFTSTSLSSAEFQISNFKFQIFLIGALLTLASCMRITTALVQLLFFIVLQAKGGKSIKQRFKTILPFLIASAIVLIWPVWVIAQAPRAFLLDVFVIQLLNSEWLHQIGLVHNKFAFTYNCLAKPGYLVLIVIAVYLCVIVMWPACPEYQMKENSSSKDGTAGRQRRRLAVSDKANLFLAALLPLVFFVIALSLPTVWRQHLAAPVPFLIIGAAYPLLYLRKLVHKAGINRYFNIAAVLVALSVLVAAVSFPAVLYRIPELLRPQSWTAIELHKISEDIGEKTKSPKIILTLAPLYALEGGCDIYTEFSAGSFVYRVADFMSPADRAVTHSVGPETLGGLLKKTPPSAVILGVEMDILEEPLLKAAIQPDIGNWKRKVYENGPIVYFRR